ncbi:MAG: transglycosylase domain-containing protein, partial [Deltaproteobacteria bacterium]|nr:transglycosylase domain-containing protein [Deltaproteobacteria bacterium]
MEIKPSIGKHIFCLITIVFIVSASAITLKTNADLMPVPESLTLDASNIRKVQVMDRHHIPLTVTYQNRWNIHDYISLHDIPQFLRQAFVISEDQRFFTHHGIDRLARCHALWQNLKALGALRGASTISEQVVRMWHPRPRTFWSRWLEGFEAIQLEKKFSKADILEFYLNQIPYASQRRGIVQAARFYFDRDPDTLSRKEMLALAVMVRAPARLNLRKNPGAITKPIHQLASRMKKRGWIDGQQVEQILKEHLPIKTPEPPVEAGHFVQHIYQRRRQPSLNVDGRMHTTLDASLQHKVQIILDHCLKDLEKKDVKNGAVLVIDHRDHEIR